MAEKKKEPKITGAEKEQRGLFKKKRAGVVLTKDEVKAIKAGRKKVRAEMRKMGVKSKKEFEITASSMGLYFDKNRGLALFWWWFWGKGTWILLGLAAVMLAVLYGISTITQLQGHFTISMSDDLFKEGFSLSETPDFKNPTSHLFASPAEGVPCVSIYDIPDHIDEIDGSHSDYYFAHTFYVRNEGDTAASIKWQLQINSESLGLSEAAWIMVFEDGVMSFYAKANKDGTAEALPAIGNETVGYTKAPLYELAKDKEQQYSIIKQTDALTYWRIIPKKFLSDSLVTEGILEDVEPMETHKFTVLVWLEGDDPDCTNDLIGGHLGLDFYMTMIEEKDKK